MTDMRDGGTVTTTEVDGKVTKLVAKIKGDWLTDEDLEHLRQRLAEERPNVDIVIERAER